MVSQTTGTTSQDLAKNTALWTGALQSAPQLAQVMFLDSRGNQQQIVLDGRKQPINDPASLLAAGLNLTLSDMPTFLAVAQNGRFVGNNQTLLADNPQRELNVGVKTFVTSRLMQEDGIFATPGDVVTPHRPRCALVSMAHFAAPRMEECFSGALPRTDSMSCVRSMSQRWLLRI